MQNFLLVGILLSTGIVNFLLSSWCGAVLWIWGDNKAGNPLMVLAVAG